MIENFGGTLKKIKEELSHQVSMRSRDVFFSYFIVFELIYNWKFLYTLASSKDPEKVAMAINNAKTFIEIPVFLKFIFEKACEPSNFVLALGSSIFMTTVYPFISSAVMFARKVVIYKANEIMSSGYPTNEEYKDLMNRYTIIERKLDDSKVERLKELGLQSDFLRSQPLGSNLSKSQYLFCMPKGNSIFEVDEVYQEDSSNSCLIQKIDEKNVQKSRIGIVVGKITDHLYVCARDLSQTIPVTKKMEDSGRQYFVVFKNGKPYYTDNIDESLEKRLMLSMPIKYEKVGSNQSVTFY